MDPAPPPPHERAWRHPSELGPPVHEPASATARVLVVAVATFGLVLVGLLVVAVTPDHTAGPGSAVGAGSAPTALTTAVVSPAASSATDSGGWTGARTPLGSSRDAVMPLVTPIGDGLGVTTEAAMAGRDRVTAELPGGDVAEVEVVATDADSGLVVVTLPPDVTPEHYSVASDPVADDAVVVLTGSPAVTMVIDDIPDVSIAEATPVLDDDGNLVGLCTADGMEIEVARVDPELADWDGRPDGGDPDDTAPPAPDPTTDDRPADVPGAPERDARADVTSPERTTATTLSDAGATSTTG